MHQICPKCGRNITTTDKDLSKGCAFCRTLFEPGKIKKYNFIVFYEYGWGDRLYQKTLIEAIKKYGPKGTVCQSSDYENWTVDIQKFAKKYQGYDPKEVGYYTDKPVNNNRFQNFMLALEVRVFLEKGFVYPLEPKEPKYIDYAPVDAFLKSGRTFMVHFRRFDRCDSKSVPVETEKRIIELLGTLNIQCLVIGKGDKGRGMHSHLKHVLDLRDADLDHAELLFLMKKCAGYIGTSSGPLALANVTGNLNTATWGGGYNWRPVPCAGRNCLIQNEYSDALIIRAANLFK